MCLTYKLCGLRLSLLICFVLCAHTHGHVFNLKFSGSLSSSEMTVTGELVPCFSTHRCFVRSLTAVRFWLRCAASWINVFYLFTGVKHWLVVSVCWCCCPRVFANTYLKLPNVLMHAAVYAPCAFGCPARRPLLVFVAHASCIFLPVATDMFTRHSQGCSFYRHLYFIDCCSCT